MRNIALALVTFTGAAGEVFALRRELIDSYPFKMLSYPPAAFYESIGNVGAIVLSILAVAGAMLALVKWPELAPALVTFLMPIAWIFSLAIATTISYGWSVPGTIQNYDETTVVAATLQFAKIALAYSAAGLIGGSVFSSLLTLALGERRQNLRARRRHLDS